MIMQGVKIGRFNHFKNFVKWGHGIVRPVIENMVELRLKCYS